MRARAPEVNAPRGRATGCATVCSRTALRGRGLAFLDEISQLVWSGRVAHWNEGEPFYGQDRFDLPVWRLEQKGLRKRGEG